jgi:hypothetical protein
MPDHNCGTCAFRAKYDTNPRSFLGKIWRWHANWCPGWKSYMKSLAADERISLADKYSMTKYMLR